ncbi:MAG: HAD-IA family hydrolase [Firmicutes bacterium]|nr:HAD-IA family hydrolase [Bacillota bacterium]MCM1400687.1 HAD-IA family hydrolase [Bacteroides sp.]MCM1476381.1 HAD-IA family hydrolase [Bacteroides sp.]
MYTATIQKFLAEHDYISVTPRAALIDMDGTLYDSMPSHALAWQQLMGELGIDLPSKVFFRYEGRTGASTIDTIFRQKLGRPATEKEMTDLYKRKTEIFASMPPVAPMPGADRMLDFLESVSIKRVLVTGSGQSSLINRLSKDFPGAFNMDLRVTSRDVKHGKPSPEPYFKAMELADVKPNECIVVENAPLGVEAGHASGAFTVGVNTGPLNPGELYESGADIVFGSMEEFAEVLPLLVYGFITTSRNFN